MTDPDTTVATSVGFRAPPFCSQDPSLWFSLLECGFQASKITNSLTKFTHAISHLPPELLPQASAVIAAAPTAATPYEDLKAALLKSLQTSVATRLRELLSKEELGDEKPSQLLHRMKQLLADKYQTFDKELFKQLFYQRLPSSMQRSLFSVKDNLDADALATLADDFMATLPPSHASSISVSSHDSQLAHLTQLVSKLTADIANLKFQLQDRSRSRSFTPRRRRSSSRSRTPGVCWYHQTFGDKAMKCVKPCTRSSNPTSE